MKNIISNEFEKLTDSVTFPTKPDLTFLLSNFVTKRKLYSITFVTTR